jgi:hypothetical protein
MAAKIAIDKDRIANFCRRWKVKGLALFGSVLREDFTPESDVDVLIEFEAGAHWSLLDLVDMEKELEDIVGRDVDLISRRGIEASRNYIRREAILSSAEPIHVS